jgi:hypothetical protein
VKTLKVVEKLNTVAPETVVFTFNFEETPLNFDQLGENSTYEIQPRIKRDAPFIPFTYNKKKWAFKNQREHTQKLSPNITCTAQDEEFEKVFQLGYTIGMVLSFPVGIILDL